jgi:ABC-type multidrug transport system ATPase subunit
MSLKESNSPIEFPLLGRGVGVRLVLNNVGKRYNREWIFRRFNYQFQSGKTYAITGANGSGKSTLLQVIAGSLTHNEGSIECIDTGSMILDKNIESSSIQYPASDIRHQVYSINKTFPPEQFYQLISIAAPYLELIEEMTATEMLHFHSSFKQLSLPITEILQTISLQNAAHKQIRYYSSGMKQRLKLAQAFFSNTPILLLDEPTTNLDAEGIALYNSLIAIYTKDKLVIVSSNDMQEYQFCEEEIRVGDYKK